VRVDLPPNRVYYDWLPNQTDYREPESPLQASRLDISVAVMQDRYDWAFLKNDARPSAVIVHEAFEQPEQETAWRRQFIESHGGPDNAGRVAWAVAAKGSPKDSLFIQQLGLSQADAQFIPRYEAKVRAICVALGVPLSRLGDSSKRTFSNADRETLNYWHDTVKPIADDFADSVNTHIAPLVDGGRRVGWFDYTRVEALRPKPRWTPTEGTAMVAAGIVSKDEDRAEYGLDALPDGGGSEAVEAPKPPVVAPIPPGAADAQPNATEIPPAGNGNAPPTTKDAQILPLRQTRAARGEVSEFVKAEQAHARRAKLWHQTNRTAESLESIWQRQIQRLFNSQQESVIARLEGKRGRQLQRAANPEDISHAYDRLYWVNKTTEMTKDLYEMVAQSAGVALSVAYGIDFDLDAPYAQGFIEARANKLAGLINDTTYTAIKEQLSEGASEGDGVPELAKRIKDLFEQTYKNRAKTVARTEVISAYNGSTSTMIQESDQIGGLEWIATHDNRVRPSHAAMDGKVIHKGQFFALDGATMLYPGDPNVHTGLDSTGSIPDPGSMIINCRCTIAPVALIDMPDEGRTVPTDLVQTAAIALAQSRCSLQDALAMLAS
jgi:SPP1 gp7 family putative phage head morphogenesis protein